MPKTHRDSLIKHNFSKIRRRCALSAVGKGVSTIITVFLVILMINICLADPPPKTGKPRGKIEISQMDYDFGYMSQRGVFSHVFVAKNVGQGVLNIVKIDPTCGCTTIPIKKAFLKPGEQVEIKVNFDSGKITGRVAKRIKVLSTDPQNGLLELYIRGMVAREPETVELSGPAVRFVKIDVTRREVQIKNISAKQGLTLSVLPLSDDFIEASLSTDKLAPGSEAVLTLTLKKNPPLGEYSSSVTVECKGEKTERISIPITGIGYAH